MRIVHFGTYSTREGYPRNLVVENALAKAGAEIIHCHSEAWGDAASRAREAASSLAAIARLFRLLVAWMSLTFEYLFKIPDHDLVLVGYPGHLDVHIARALSLIRKKPVVLDVFLSVYEAAIEDRELARPESLKAKFYKFLDSAACRAADKILIDTDAHTDYFGETIGADENKFIRVFVGAEDNFRARDSASVNSGEVLFFGSFLPLHGADTIIKAAAILKENPEIKFTIIGDGPEWEKCSRLAADSGARIEWLRGFMNYEKLVAHISQAEICLGIFSAGAKAARVIPCKVFNVLAMGKPLITADTVAAREALTDGVNAILVPPGNPEKLADAILNLHKDTALRSKIAKGGFDLFDARFSVEAMGRELAPQLEKLVAERKNG